MESEIETLLQPITDELGLDILKVSLGGGGRSQMLKVVVDQTGGVGADALARVSRGLALQMDAEDLIKGAYRLEVTSPGLDWPLETEADFVRHQGEWIKVSFLEGTSWEGRNLGPVKDVDADAAVSNISDVSFTLLIEAKKARDNRQEVISMREVQKVVRAINWSEVSRNS
ncbi:ribosome assembly cofactor RimP [Mariprofundus ferrooxydans]|nr:ribosome assembly cofactor RimP [Mariprofundus ferrooxydans]